MQITWDVLKDVENVVERAEENNDKKAYKRSKIIEKRVKNILFLVKIGHSVL